jgi:hypothetical protein
VITLDRLQQIIPADQALANKALSVALGQIAGISNVPLPIFATTVRDQQTTRDLPLITALTTAVPPSVADYYTSTLAVGNGPNGTIQVADVIGLAGGWVATDAFTQTVSIFSTMNLTALTTVYETMYHACNGDYGDTEAGPLTIPGGLPCAGTYTGTEVPPVPPAIDPTYDPTALDLAMACLTGAATTETTNLEIAYPTQCSELNVLWNSMAQQIVQENSLQSLIHLNYDDLQANSRTSIYSFIYSLPTYGLENKVGGVAWLLENMADLTSLSGEAVVGCLRQGHNQVTLSQSGIYTNLNIPADPNPPAEDAVLLPSTYTEAEAAKVVVK